MVSMLSAHSVTAYCLCFFQACFLVVLQTWIDLSMKTLALPFVLARKVRQEQSPPACVLQF
jgi:hypothetical protein